ncbi:CysS/YqeB C-terminal domain-containing protein [Nocardia vinacea]|nr:hypothetical protein [Nocardia vinacea]
MALTVADDHVQLAQRRHFYLDDKLLALGIDVRDRKGEQQIRVAGQR